MKKIRIGRNGDQPFKITAAGVSGIHASLTIFDDGVWLLEDEGSTNGTYVRNEKLRFERIDKRRITPNTLIRLGDETIKGITFYASRMISEDQKAFPHEFKELKRQLKNLKQEKDKIQRKTTYRKFIPMLFCIVLIVLTILPPFRKMVESIGISEISALRIMMFLPSFLTPLMDLSGKKDSERLSEKYNALLVCPDCGNRISTYEISRGQCSRCKAHC